MKINYCLPILKTTKKNVLQTIEKYRDEYDYFEIWLDYVIDFDLVFVAKLRKLLNEKLILVLRRKDLTPTHIDVTTRLHIIGRLEHSKVLLDLDIKQHKEELVYIKKSDIPVQIIVSYHNYEKTPALALLIDEMIAARPTILKIATHCNTEDDAIRLLQIISSLKKRHQRFIILGMGEYGTITRVFGTLWGNEMIFAPKTLKEQSAEGQLTKKQLEKIFTELTNK